MQASRLLAILFAELADNNRTYIFVNPENATHVTTLLSLQSA
jgi:hypothetical protein